MGWQRRAGETCQYGPGLLTEGAAEDCMPGGGATAGGRENTVERDGKVQFGPGGDAGPRGQAVKQGQRGTAGKQGQPNPKVGEKNDGEMEKVEARK